MQTFQWFMGKASQQVVYSNHGAKNGIEAGLKHYLFTSKQDWDKTRSTPTIIELLKVQLDRHYVQASTY